MKEDCIHKRRGAYLPHWTKNNAIYSINFRLADALPTHVLKEWKGEREDILHSWKSFTAKRMNKALNRNGQVWQEEYYDHLIRSPEDLHHAIEYTWSNPEKAGLIRWQWRWKGKGDPFDVFVEKTPCTQIRQDPV